MIKIKTNILDFKYIILMISIILFSVFVGTFEFFGDKSFYIGITLTFVFALFYPNLSNIFLNKKIGRRISSGVLYSLIIGAILLSFLSSGDYAYEIVQGDTTYIGDTFYLYVIGVYLFSIFLCFIINTFFNKELRKISRLKILLNSFLFYCILYVFSLILAFLIAIIDMGIKWN